MVAEIKNRDFKIGFGLFPPPLRDLQQIKEYEILPPKSSMSCTWALKETIALLGFKIIAFSASTCFS